MTEAQIIDAISAGGIAVVAGLLVYWMRGMFARMFPRL